MGVNFNLTYHLKIDVQYLNWNYKYVWKSVFLSNLKHEVWSLKLKELTKCEILNIETGSLFVLRTFGYK